MTSQETTLRFMNDIGPFICVLLHAAHCSKIALRITLEKNGPKRNGKQWLCKIWGWQRKSIMVCYGIFWSGQLHSLLKIYKSPNRPTNMYRISSLHQKSNINPSVALLSLVSESCPCVIHSGGTREGVRFPLFLDQTEARKRDRVQHLLVQTACVTVIFKTLN